MPLTVSSLHVYPVKGLGGVAVDAVRVTDRGLEHDRRWMLVEPDGTFLTQREHPRMATVWTDFVDGSLELSAPGAGEVRVPLAGTDGPRMRVEVWGTACDAVAVSPEADAMLSGYLGAACRLVHMPDDSIRHSNPRYSGDGKRVGFADGYAHLVIGEASLADLNRRLAARGHGPLPMNRFRPNIVVAGSAAYDEDTWGEVRVGDAALRGAKPCGRCQVTTTDQSTGEVRGPEPLATLSTYRDSKEFGTMFGMNMVTLREGTIRVGDTVSLA